MSWRRFRVLFNGVFNFNENATETYESGKGLLARTVDWGSADHPDLPDDLLTQFPGNKIYTGPEIDG